MKKDKANSRQLGKTVRNTDKEKNNLKGRRQASSKQKWTEKIENQKTEEANQQTVRPE